MILRKLNPVDAATYTRTQGCLAGTRQRFIDDAIAWCQKSAGADKMLWIHGQIGIGKSAIAASVCEQLGRQPKVTLAASFFCNSDDPELHDPKLMIQTIVYGLATLHSSYGKAVCTVLREDNQFFDCSIQRMYEGLVQQPMKHVADAAPASILVVLVDALDECRTETRAELLSCFLDMSRLVPWLKVVITSRPGADIRDFVEQPSVTGVTSFDVRTYDASVDIDMFMRSSLRNTTDSDSLSQAIITSLSSRANGLFVWAKIVCDYILGGPDRAARLHRVLSDGDTFNIFSRLDFLYTRFLESIVSAESGIGISAFRLYIGAIVVTLSRRPLPVSALGKLLHKYISPNILEHIISILGPVLCMSNDGAGVCAHHPSFSNYIDSPARSGALCLNIPRRNAELAGCCLDIMLQGLRFNICGLETSHVLNKDIIDLDQRVSAAICPALAYSCGYWVSHLCGTTIETMKQELYDNLCEFMFGPMLLYWIEALSLLGDLNLAAQSLLQLVRLLSVRMATRGLKIWN
jgi:hypothetical protein